MTVDEYTLTKYLERNLARARRDDETNVAIVVTLDELELLLLAVRTYEPERK